MSHRGRRLLGGREFTGNNARISSKLELMRVAKRIGLNRKPHPESLRSRAAGIAGSRQAPLAQQLRGPRPEERRGRGRAGSRARSRNLAPAQRRSSSRIASLGPRTALTSRISAPGPISEPACAAFHPMTRPGITASTTQLFSRSRMPNRRPPVASRVNVTTRSAMNESWERDWTSSRGTCHTACDTGLAIGAPTQEMALRGPSRARTTRG